MSLRTVDLNYVTPIVHVYCIFCQKQMKFSFWLHNNKEQKRYSHKASDKLIFNAQYLHLQNRKYWSQSLYPWNQWLLLQRHTMYTKLATFKHYIVPIYITKNSVSYQWNCPSIFFWFWLQNMKLWLTYGFLLYFQKHLNRYNVATYFVTNASP